MEAKKLLEYGGNGIGRNNGTKSFDSSIDRHNATSRQHKGSQMPNDVQDVQNGPSGQPMSGVLNTAPHSLGTPSGDPPQKDKNTEAKTGTSTLRSLSRRGSVFVKKSRNSVDSLLRSSRPDIDQSLPPQGRPATPNGRTLNVASTISQSTKSRPLSVDNGKGTFEQTQPRKTVLETEETLGSQQAQRKEELKSAFRNLESDCQKFLAKPVTVRTSVVRSCLFRFLSKHGSSSHDGLRLEYIEKRCMVFKTWWAALLQTLKAKPSENLSEVDRATIRDAILGVMERSEWVTRRSADIRSNFAQMIYSQLSYVTEKMSQRRLPTNANLISFCGKSCAYAFVYCPLAAGVLISVWDIKPDSLKRLLQSSKVKKPWKSGQGSAGVASHFPRHMQSLAFSSLRTSTNVLKTKPQIPRELTQIQWDDCHWVTRWCGKESHLFCEFLQHFNVLLGFLLPQNSTYEEILFAPGVLFVHAQITTLLDYMIHPQSTSPLTNSNEALSSQNIDDVLRFDSVAPTLSAPPAVAQRQMTDSHIVRLARELLSDTSEVQLPASLLFAQSLCHAIKATSLATSIYDHSACFAFCEFLQEALKIISPYERRLHREEALIDWPFLVEVFCKMLKSENTMTEIRFYVLLFNIWPTVSSVAWLKDRICSDMLLDADHFHARFNHWCPMVRGYYMRLLCWRIARFDGNHLEQDVQILETLFMRLRKTWSQHKLLQERMQHENLIPMSTTPCNPAPGRRLLIIRTDIPSTSASLPLSRMSASNSGDSDIFGSSNNGTFNAAQLAEKLSMSLSMNTEPGQRRNSLFKSFIGSRTPDKGSRSKSPVRTASTPPSPQRPNSGEFQDHYRKAVSMPPSPSGSARPSLYEQRPIQSLSTSPTKLYRPATFKFSLELVDPRRAVLQQMQLEPPRLPSPAQQYLQSRPGFRGDIPAAGLPPDGASMTPLKYSGRALAEWTLVVNECQNFFERRRGEGVPSNRLVETPVLTVESLRRPL